METWLRFRFCFLARRCLSAARRFLLRGLIPSPILRFDTIVKIWLRKLDLILDQDIRARKVVLLPSLNGAGPMDVRRGLSR